METKRCIICKRDITENGPVCWECIRFYKWKYKKAWKKQIHNALLDIDRETLEDDANLNSQGGKK